AVVIEERRAFAFHDLHQPAEPEHFVGFGGAGSSRHDQLARRVRPNGTEHRSKGVGLRDAGRVVFRGPGVVGFDGHDLARHDRVQRDFSESLCNCAPDFGSITGDHDVWHGHLSAAARLCNQRAGSAAGFLAGDRLMRRIAFWLKVAYTAFVVALVPIYRRQYGWRNFLWFSDIALFMTLPALWLERPLLASMPAVSVLVPEAAW